MMTVKMLGPVNAEWIGLQYHTGEHIQAPGCGVEPKCTPVDPNDRSDMPLNDSPRESALDEAKNLITGDRNAQYGPPTQDFARAAAALNAYGYGRTDAQGVIHDILASDVAIIVPLIKISRLMHTRDKRDSWVDIAGYAGCGYECAVEEQGNGGS